jgi:hypothetical protein
MILAVDYSQVEGGPVLIVHLLEARAMGQQHINDVVMAANDRVQQGRQAIAVLPVAAKDLGLKRIKKVIPKLPYISSLLGLGPKENT